MHPFSLRGKNALVTGGARGLGLEIARTLVKKGMNVAVIARERDEIDRALDSLRSGPGGSTVRGYGRECDLRDEAAIDSLLGHLRDEFGPVDILVNNAGTIQVGPLEAMTMSDFEEAMKLHVFAPLRLTLGLRDGMRARGGGRVGNVSSIGGVVAVPHLLPYSASKFALVGLSRGLRAELAGDRIFVTTITPGLMRTGSPGGALFKGQNEKEYAWFAISDSMPLLSMSSRRAAHRIVRALERGEPNLVLGLPAKVAAVASGVAPGLVARTMALANGLLPRIAGGAGGAGGKGSVDERARARKGSASASRLVPSILTRLSGRAAARNNEPPLAARGADADAAPRP